MRLHNSRQSIGCLPCFRLYSNNTNRYRQVPNRSALLPTGPYNTNVRLLLPSRLPCFRRIQVIPITVYKRPAGLHCPPLVHVVPMSIYRYPASAHCSPLVHIVPMSVYCYPTGLHCSPPVSYTHLTLPTIA